MDQKRAKCASEEGNTDSSSPPENCSKNACKRYSWTYNNYPEEDLEKLESVLNVLGNWIYGFEIGENKTPHLQGYICLNTKQRITGLKKIPELSKIHFESCRGNEAQNIQYCIKDGNWRSNFHKEKVKLKIINILRPWQKRIEDIIKEAPDDRTINWIYDPSGNNGKTVFCKYLAVKHNAIIATAGDAKDIANLLSNEVETSNRDLNDNTTIVFNLARHSNISYKALEGVKDGLMTNLKYECKQLIFNCPHVWVFANEEPLFHKLSRDRWRTWKIQDNDLIEYMPVTTLCTI